MEFLTETVFRLGDYEFELDFSPGIRSRVSEDNHFILMKPRGLVETMAKRLQALPKPKVIVEFGIQRGGSVAFFNELLKPDLHIAMELDRPPIAALETFRARAALKGRTLKLHYGVDQGDREKVGKLILEDLREAGLSTVNLVIDDASHLYEPSRNSFEVIFPLMSHGAQYVIEDWAWAHSKRYQQSDSPYANKPALSNLVFELVALCGSRSDLLSQIVIIPGLVFACRGWQKIDSEGFKLDDLILFRGRKLTLV